MTDHPLREGIATALAVALSVVFPTWCVGCDAPDLPLCPICRAELVPCVSVRHLEGLAVYSALPFDGVAARILRAAKEEGRTGLLGALAPALRATVEAAREDAGPGTLTLVPIPVSPAAMRRRGYRVVELLCRGARLPSHRLLRTHGHAADQRSLGAAERRQNVAGSFRAHGLGGRRVLLVDDVITTGATLTEAARTLAEAGAHVVAAVTVASTGRRGFLPATDR